MRKDSILQNYYYQKLPKAKIGIQTSGDPNLPYHPITNPEGYRNKISDVLKVAQKRQEQASDNTPTIKQGRTELPYEKRAREERLKEQAQQNSELAQTMSLFTPSGSNMAAGAVGAENFVNVNPFITGPIMSTSRLYGAGRSMVDPNTYNPYFNSDNGVAGNILGGLQLAGDLGMVHTSLRTPTGDFNPTVDITKETYWPDFNERNLRVKQAWENAKTRKSGISPTGKEYMDFLKQQELEKQRGDVLRTMGTEDPNKGGWSPTHNPEVERMINFAQTGRNELPPPEQQGFFNPKSWFTKKQPIVNTPASAATLQENLAAARNQTAGSTPLPAGRPVSSTVPAVVKTPFWKKALRTGVGLGIASAVPAEIINLSNQANSAPPAYSNLPIIQNVSNSDSNVIIPKQYIDTSNINPSVYDTLGIPSHAYGGPLVNYYAGKMNHGEMFAKGGEYELSDYQIQDLINKGYKIKYL